MPTKCTVSEISDTVITRNALSQMLYSVALHCQRSATEKLGYIIQDRRKKLLGRFKPHLPFIKQSWHGFLVKRFHIQVIQTKKTGGLHCISLDT